MSRRAQRQRISPSPEPQPNHLASLDYSSAALIIGSPSNSIRMTHPNKANLSDHALHVPEESKMNNSSSSNSSLPKKTSSASDLDPFERKKQIALTKAETKLEKAQRLYQSAQESVEQNISEFLRVTTIPGILHESKSTNGAYEKRIRTLQETKKELEKKIATYQADILRIQSGEIPQHYSSSKDILNNIKNKVVGGNSKQNSTNDVSTTAAVPHEIPTIEPDLPTTNQNFLSLSQNSNTLDVTRSSPSNSISNEFGKRDPSIGKNSNQLLNFQMNIFTIENMTFFYQVNTLTSSLLIDYFLAF